METTALQKVFDILLIEHDPGDAQAIQTALGTSDVATKIHHIRDGVQALAFLRRGGVYRQVPKPNLILLNLNLPRVNGSRLLAQIKAAPDLRAIPVFVLADPANEAHLASAANLLADAVIPKPVNGEALRNGIRALAASFGGPASRAAAVSSSEAQVLIALAHELRTHLNPIIAFSEMMKLEIRGPLDSEYREYARGIYQSALALSRVVFDILDRSEAAVFR